jgi:hypothetical protein
MKRKPQIIWDFIHCSQHNNNELYDIETSCPLFPSKFLIYKESTKIYFRNLLCKFIEFKAMIYLLSQGNITNSTTFIFNWIWMIHYIVLSIWKIGSEPILFYFFLFWQRIGLYEIWFVMMSRDIDILVFLDRMIMLSYDVELVRVRNKTELKT